MAFGDVAKTCKAGVLPFMFVYAKFVFISPFFFFSKPVTSALVVFALLA